MITLLGVPWDGSSSFQRGAAQAPPRIRAALQSPSSNLWNERGDDLAAAGLLDDAGDVATGSDAEAARGAIEQAVRAILERGGKPLLLGGDHSITYPAIRAFGTRASAMTIVHLDAHPDLYDEFEGDRYSHACAFARIASEKLAGRIMQIGVRTLNGHQRSQAARYGVEVLGADRWRDALPLLGRLRGPVYLTIDLDVIEPMLAPGVSHPEPGGLTVRELLEVLAALRTPVAGADIVEYNPENDVRDLTARVAAKLVKEVAGVMKV